jgi:hypothetical protein
MMQLSFLKKFPFLVLPTIVLKAEYVDSKSSIPTQEANYCLLLLKLI